MDTEKSSSEESSYSPGSHLIITLLGVVICGAVVPWVSNESRFVQVVAVIFFTFGVLVVIVSLAEAVNERSRRRHR